MPLPLSEFADRVNSAMAVVMREFASRHVGDLFKNRLTLPQFFILNFLDYHGQAKMKDLAEYGHVTTAAMTGIIERLVRDGYVRRAPEPGDRRIVKVSLTAKGQAISRKINEQRRQMVMRIFGKLPEADRLEYLRILTQVKDLLKNKDIQLK